MIKMTAELPEKGTLMLTGILESTEFFKQLAVLSEAKKIVDLFSLLILASGKNLIEQLGKKITKTLFIFFRLHSLNGYSVSSGRMNNYGF